MKEEKRLEKIVYSCYHSVSRQGENFVPAHVLSYQLAGTFVINDGSSVHTFNDGDFHFSRRNQLAKFSKYPPAEGDYKAVAILFDQETLRNISLEFGITATKKYTGKSFVRLPADPLYKSYMESLMPYLELSQADNEILFSLKVKEALFLLVKTNPELKNILFDFSEPGKIDLEKFMLTNYQFNVGLDRLAYLTGRSLATFKRDFEKTFHTSPSRWLLKQRLQEAYYQIKENGKKASDVYLELGFEDLSHFSYAFKNAYGRSPSRV